MQAATISLLDMHATLEPTCKYSIDLHSAGAQPINYPAPQQYGKPPVYGMPSQGQPPQS
ncbi:hypothetical protein Fmac_024166 [Flemingia macrophylla]|uniref:Uncharacterized protein n=1 Tax=Flemingia macrophylla TaxID=520843 RepID=A0ABD1LNK7_9FABA